MKTVVNSAQVAHIWANRNQAQARNGGGSIFFDKDVIYSYGKHWPLATFTPWKDANGRTIVLEHDDARSVSTTRHASHVRDALRGHPVRLVPLSSLDNGQALRAAAGELDVIPGIVCSLANTARRVYLDTVNRRDPWRIAHRFDAIAKHRAAADMLAALLPRKDRAAAMRAAGDWPSLPTTWRDDDGRALDNLADGMREARAAIKRERAARDLADMVRNIRHAWTCANNRHAGASIDVATRHGHAQRAAEMLAKLPALAKQAGTVVPRSMPSVRTVARLVATLAPAAAVYRGAQDLAQLRHSARLHRECYASAQRANVRGDDYLRDILARTLRTGGRYAGNSLRGMVELSAACGRVIALDMTASTIANLVDARDNAPTPAARLAARDMLADLQREARAFADWHADRGARVWAWEVRENVARAARMLEDARTAAANPDAMPQTLARAVAAAEHYAQAAAEYARDNPRRLGGIAPLVSPDVVDAWKAREKIAGILSALAAGEATVDQARESLRACGDAIAAGHHYQAGNESRTMLTRLTQARRNADIARDRMAAEPGADPDNVARDRLAALVASTESATAAHALMSSTAADAMAAFQARAANSGTDAARMAWRSGDRGAPTPSGVVFRLAASGEVESTLGARVSQDAARRLWALIRATVARGESRTWAPYAGPHVGAFSVSRIGADGSAVVGCHSITASEARAFAAAMHWPPFGDATAADELPADMVQA